MLRALRSGLEQDLHTTEEIDAALATAKSVKKTKQKTAATPDFVPTPRGLRQMSERACCV